MDNHVTSTKVVLNYADRHASDPFIEVGYMFYTYVMYIVMSY
jgi:hypothetical protein